MLLFFRMDILSHARLVHSPNLSKTMHRFKEKTRKKYIGAIVFGATKFHKYIYVESDHRPLESLFKKPLSQTLPRIQRMMLKVQKYDFRVHYKSGRELHIADTSSRACISQTEDYVCDSD